MDARHTEPVPVRQRQVTGWTPAGDKASYLLDGEPGLVTLSDGVEFMNSITAAVHEAAVEATRNPPDPNQPARDWLETTPLWALFEAVDTPALEQAMLATAHLMAAADQAGELLAMYLVTARGVQVQFPEADAPGEG